MINFFKSKLFLAIVSILVFAIYSKVVYNSGYEQGDKDGRGEVEKVYKDEAEKKNAEILTLKEDISDLRDSKADELEQLKKKREENENELKERYESIIAGLNADNVRLSVNLRNRDASETTETKTPETGQCNDDRGGSFLPRRTSQFLVSQARRADLTAIKLKQCQDTVRSYLNAVDQYNKLLEKGNEDAG